MAIRQKRAYEPPAPRDGYRVLVDRLWPRGVSKEHAAIDEWLKELAPSDALRKWFGHDPARFREFRARYEEELKSERPRELLAALAKRAARKTVTLVYAAKDEEHNNAVVLAAKLTRMTSPAKPRKAAAAASPRTKKRSSSK
jgi:uncharacterized protein YeaO (DUF488 family)